jgi:hypothetical protein
MQLNYRQSRALAKETFLVESDAEALPTRSGEIQRSLVDNKSKHGDDDQLEFSSPFTLQLNKH